MLNSKSQACETMRAAVYVILTLFWPLFVLPFVSARSFLVLLCIFYTIAIILHILLVIPPAFDASRGDFQTCLLTFLTGGAFVPILTLAYALKCVGSVLPPPVELWLSGFTLCEWFVWAIVEMILDIAWYYRLIGTAILSHRICLLVAFFTLVAGMTFIYVRKASFFREYVAVLFLVLSVMLLWTWVCVYKVRMLGDMR